jgi:flap endonuclease-1|tara:strand:- start:1153 stop:2184 length:1032 start_codon:yes stop_codon:yes gene_type:complete
MGVNLSDIISPKPIELQSLNGKRIAIDAMNSLYQFLSIIRQPTGELLHDRKGRVTSHLSGLLYRNASLLESGIQPIYVFDGKPPALKNKVVRKRREVRELAGKKWIKAREEGRVSEARKYAMQSSRFTREMLSESKELLTCLGIPWVQAPAEGEAQAASMVISGDAWAVGSQDYDSVLLGAPRIIRNLNFSGRRKVPRKNIYTTVNLEILYLEDTLTELGINLEQLIEISILIGTDYNPKGVEGIGPKRAYSLIKKYGTVSNASKMCDMVLDFNLDNIKELFLNHDTTEDYILEWNPPSTKEVREFLCYERDFSIDRVNNTLKKFSFAYKEIKSQASLDNWFS